MIVLWLILAAVVVLAAVVLVRTALFTPGTAPAVPEGEETIDRDKAVENLRTLIRCRTVSNTNHALEDDAEFEKLINTLPTLYPNVFKTCKFERLEDRGLLFTWSGKEHTEPTVLMAHYDVVDVDEAGWKKPPFEGVLEDGVLWGRGALDTKVTFNGVLTAADKLIGEGYTPAQDIYFAFSGGEEVNGLGAVHIVDWFEANHITPALVVDEGGAVVEDVFPGVKQPCGLIGKRYAERGVQGQVRRRPRQRTQAPQPACGPERSLHQDREPPLQGARHKASGRNVRYAGPLLQRYLSHDLCQPLAVRRRAGFHLP